jgi:hypothetical protein
MVVMDENWKLDTAVCALYHTYSRQLGTRRW